MTMLTMNLQGADIDVSQFLIQKLNNVKKILDRNWDCFIIIAGKERSGKSTLGLTAASYLYPQLTAQNIAIDGEDAIAKFKTLPNRSVLLIDEGSTMFSSKDSMVSEQKKLIKILNVIGQKQLVMILCIPSYFDLNQYLACERARFLLVTYTNENLERGNAMYFGTDKLMKLYKHGKKNYHSYTGYDCPESDFIFKFKSFEPSWFKEYLKVKQDTLTATLNQSTTLDRAVAKRMEKMELKTKEYQLYLSKLIQENLANRALSQRDLGRIMGVPQHKVFFFRDKAKESQKNDEEKVPYIVKTLPTFENFSESEGISHISNMFEGTEPVEPQASDILSV